MRLQDAAVTLLITLSVPAATYAQEPPSMPVCGSTFIERMSRTTKTWYAEADAIVRARTYGHTPFDEDEVFFTIEQDITVFEVFKAHERLLPPGASQRVLQIGFRKENVATFDARTASSFLAAGADWILFLFWLQDDGAFLVPWEEEGAIEVRDGRLAPKGSTPFAKFWRGKSVEELEAALRAAGK